MVAAEQLTVSPSPHGNSKVRPAVETGTAVRALAGTLRDAHGSVSSLVFGTARRYAGPAVTPVEVIHDAAMYGFYAGAAEVADLAAQGLAGAVREGAKHLPGQGRGVETRANAFSAFVQGFTGDKFAESPLTYRMSLRRSGHQVEPTTQGLAAAYPDHAANLVVFVHGFVGTEQLWKRRARRDEEGLRLSYGRRLEATGDWSALWLRYNTGQRVSTNGADLGQLLTTVVENWPQRVERLVLVGHSMGGLVVHSALLQAPRDSDWAELTTDTITLGTPYHGALLEKSVNRLAHEMQRTTATRLVAGVLRWRSSGIKDLRHGNLLEEDWVDHDPDDLVDWRVGSRRFRPIRHLAVAGVVTSDPHAWQGRLLGDLMVSRRSARGLDASMWDSVMIGGVNHMDLLNNEDVYELIAERIDAERLPTRHQRR